MIWRRAARKRKGSVLAGRNAGVARIVSTEGGRHVGMGIVVGPRCVLTCAHVVNLAMGSDGKAVPRPTRPLQLAFPLLPELSPRLAEVTAWHPVGRDGRPGDLAVLTLVADEPDIDDRVGVARLADVTGRLTDDDPLSVYGLLHRQPTGEHVPARFVGYALGGLTQVNSTDTLGRLVRPGFSGSGVYDAREQAVVGMVQSLKADGQSAPGDLPETKAEPPLDPGRAALVLPARQLAELVPALPVEVRARPPWFDAVWSLTAGAFLVFSLAHMWAVQHDGRWIGYLAPNSQHPMLAAYFGVHIVGTLALGTALLLWFYARDFPHSHWSRRVPPMPYLRVEQAPGPRYVMALLVAVLFVGLPLWNQGHLVKTFLKNGEVYAHVRTFGPEAWGTIDPKTCIRNQSFCPHPGGRWRLMSPAPGYEGGYFDDAYRYGQQRDGVSRVAVTFFPVLQPLAVLAVSAAALLICLAWAWQVVQPPKLWRRLVRRMRRA